MQLTSILRRAAQVNPNGAATICKDRQHSWSQTLARVEKLAGALQDLGMGAGDRVALLSLNSDRYIEYYYAVVWGGGAMMPLNVRWSPAECAYALNDAGAEILLVEPSAAMAALLHQRLDSLPVRIDVTDDGLAALELYLHRRHDIVVTPGEPRRLHGPALIAAIRQQRNPALCLLITADATISKAASGGADHVLQRDRELPDRLGYLISRHIEAVSPTPSGP